MAKPVTRSATKRKRRVGMSPAAKKRFLISLAMTAHVSASCNAAKVSSQTIYRERMRSAVFRQDWHDALTHGVSRLRLKILQRALGMKEEDPEGVERAPEGAKEPSDRLIAILLNAHQPTVEAGPERMVKAASGSDLQRRLAAKLERMREAIGDGDGA